MWTSCDPCCESNREGSQREFDSQGIEMEESAGRKQEETHEKESEINAKRMGVGMRWKMWRGKRW
jgi:hypothetical protein